ncbi:HAMP domain-containing histidine kinase [Sphingomonas sp. AP4-R1]|uniref:sensor histidine kinase n=1 Tax=Sphingomonas sp. AP4-R1 TaxID=2735134 RepID=UPI0014934526|nr:HAMP domain-containing sensor histidine kinase [Sphingomonas sp. AP4-R1]QJU59339.1 HAMP domain-containing histidine kinase [Sphingomonas sp. AP4-R1]
MKYVPRSLFGRLLAVATLTTIAALAFAAVSIGHVLERFVTRGLDQQLDTQVAILARAIEPDGRLDRKRTINLPMFEETGSGWGWRVDGPAGHWSQGATFEPERERRHHPSQPGVEHGRQRDREPVPGEGRDNHGQRVHSRQLSLSTSAGPVLLTAAGPRRVSEQPLREAMEPLFVSLGLLGCALAAATLLQLRFGLRPLHALRRDLGAVREGRIRRIPGGQPVELASLAAELNALIDQNEESLAHARRHVSNLAHGLKTPLAALALKVSEPGRDPDGALGEMVAQIDRRVRHHLGRARAAAPGGSQRLRSGLVTAVSDLLLALRRIHADRQVTATVRIDPEVAVAVDRHDLDEMVGNLLDNAWRHAASRIELNAVRDGSIVRIIVQDDGPGLSLAAIDEALMPGRRLDERGDGHGFGLPIAQELAELNGGGLELQRASDLGGLCVTLSLPASGGGAAS